MRPGRHGLLKQRRNCEEASFFHRCIRNGFGSLRRWRPYGIPTMRIADDWRMGGSFPSWRVEAHDQGGRRLSTFQPSALPTVARLAKIRPINSTKAARSVASKPANIASFASVMMGMAASTKSRPDCVRVNKDARASLSSGWRLTWPLRSSRDIAAVIAGCPITDCDSTSTCLIGPPGSDPSQRNATRNRRSERTPSLSPNGRKVHIAEIPGAGDTFKLMPKEDNAYWLTDRV